MMTRARNTSEKARDIITDTTKNYSVFELYRMPTFSSIKDQIKKERKKKHVVYPTIESDIPSSLKNICSGDVFLQFDSGIFEEDRDHGNFVPEKKIKLNYL